MLNSKDDPINKSFKKGKTKEFKTLNEMEKNDIQSPILEEQPEEIEQNDDGLQTDKDSKNEMPSNESTGVKLPLFGKKLSSVIPHHNTSQEIN